MQLVANLVEVAPINVARKQILQQAATALLAQANNGQQGLLKMLTR